MAKRLAPRPPDPAADYVRQWLAEDEAKAVCNAQFTIDGMAFVRRAELWTFTHGGAPAQAILLIGKSRSAEGDHVMQVFFASPSNFNGDDQRILRAMTEAAARIAEGEPAD